MKIGFSTSYTEVYWGPWFQEGRQLGGSEMVVVEVACGLAAEHEVTVRLPYDVDDFVHRGVRWVGIGSAPMAFDVLFAFDDYERRDRADIVALVALRSDPPRHANFDQLCFLSAHHARLMGHAGRPFVGGGVRLSDYATPLPRVPRRVLCSVSPDRAPMARRIGEACGDFVHTYRPVQGFQTVEVSREDLVAQQKQARVFIYPYDPVRESDFFSMATLEAMAAGTPVVIADGESHVEWWGDAALVIPRPTDIGAWYEAVTEVLEVPSLWKKYSRLGRERAKGMDWALVSQRYLDMAVGA